MIRVTDDEVRGLGEKRAEEDALKEKQKLEDEAACLQKVLDSSYTGLGDCFRAHMSTKECALASLELG